MKSFLVPESGKLRLAGKEKWERSELEMTFMNYFMFSTDKGFMCFSHDTVAASEADRQDI